MRPPKQGFRLTSFYRRYFGAHFIPFPHRWKWTKVKRRICGSCFSRLAIMLHSDWPKTSRIRLVISSMLFLSVWPKRAKISHFGHLWGQMFPTTAHKGGQKFGCYKIDLHNNVTENSYILTNGFNVIFSLIICSLKFFGRVFSIN